MQALLQSIPEATTSPPAVDEHGATLLHHAAKAGNVQLLDALIPLATSPSHPLHPLSALRTQAGASPIHVAAYHGQVAALNVLLNTPFYRAEVNARDGWRRTPLHYAAMGGSVAAIEALAAAGGTVDTTCERGSTPLQMAAAAGYPNAVRALLTLGAAVNSKDWRDSRAVQYAAFYAKPEVVAALLEANAQADTKDRDQLTLLHYIALGGSQEAFKSTIARFPADSLMTMTAKHSSTLIHAAAAGGNEALLSTLLNRFGDSVLRAKNADGALPIHVAATCGRLKAMTFLLNKAPDMLDATDNSRATPLLKAAYSGSLPLVMFLIEKGARVDVLDEEGAGVIHKAAWSGAYETLAYLLEVKPALIGQLTLGDVSGATPLHKAAFNGKEKTSAFLIKKGAALNAKDATGGLPVHNAAYGGHLHALRVLLECSRPPRLDLANVHDGSGRTPMHFAAASGRPDCVELLKLFGGEVNAPSKDGRSPLYYAWKRGHEACVAQLLLLGAQFSRRDRQTLSVTETRNLNSVIRPDTLSTLLKNASAVRTAESAANNNAGVAVPPPRRRARGGAAKSAPTGPNAINKRSSVMFKSDGLSPEVARAKAVEAFNTRPKAGIQAAISAGVIGHAPGDLARFLFGQTGIDKVKIGEYIGEMDEFPQEVLQAFIALIDLTHCDLDIALRRMLTKFRLPGEAQKIDRIMQKFARQYYADNTESGLFASSDAVYVLSFATIMLNTDAHNPNVKKENKMSKAQFVHNSKGHNGKGDWPTEYLEDLYMRIVEEEIKMEVDKLALPFAVMKAWMQISNNKKEKKALRRLVVLTEDIGVVIFAGKNTEEPPFATFSLKGAQLIKEPTKKLAIRVDCAPEAPMTIKRNEKDKDKGDKEPTSWYLQASNEVEFNNWCRALMDFAKATRSRRSAATTT